MRAPGLRAPASFLATGYARPVSSPIVLYDGTCGFCDASIQWILARDRAGVFRFAAQQGETAAAIVARHPELPKDLDSLILVEGEGAEERVTWHSSAALGIAARLPGAWRALSWFGLLPRALTDLGYRMVARVRYRIWGRLDACRVPRPEERARFLP